MVKRSAYNAGDLGSIPESRRSPGEGNGNPLQYSCPENFKELDMTEQLSTHTYITAQRHWSYAALAGEPKLRHLCKNSG